VPQYNPSTVVISSPTPVYTYWPAPYPVYYYPYAPGAAFATGLIWGAAITAAWNGGHYVSHYEGGNNTININREGNVNRAEVKNELSNRAANRSADGTSASQRSTQWRSEKKPGQVSGASTRASAQRVGDAPSRAGARTPTVAQSPRAQSAGNLQGRGGDAFSGYGSAQGARADSARGAASRQSMSGGQGGRNFQGGFSGGARGGFGGGGRGGRR
jgi:hypothetical protein